MIKAKLVLSTIFALVCSTAYAGSCVPDGLDLSSRDFSRLHTIDQSRIKGLAEAMLGENASDRAIVKELYSMGIGAPKVVPTGNYKCRTIKLGGISALVSYKFFDCRISQAGDQLRLEKLSGSQRFVGTLHMQETGVAYKGASHYGYEEPRAYGVDGEHDQVGCLFEALGKPTSILLELPAPQFESVHDVIELVRQ
ncbi:DUF4893 domain-containing protein [Maritalea porphyrae]|jgi:hypothetical protein|uniref:DUF4893 domain-containing protein n=1 Tax=Maritalea porphyrae TaxID=880732 RepID=UPI0022AF090B|nr:DUF4893 domain-containing protein [Maritalea porphyrae]MCZ4272417.1 DUF4893 domain-containing protein [Maritalea porphyrae]